MTRWVDGWGDVWVGRGREDVTDLWMMVRHVSRKATKTLSFPFFEVSDYP